MWGVERGRGEGWFSVTTLMPFQLTYYTPRLSEGGLLLGKAAVAIALRHGSVRRTSDQSERQGENG